MIRKIICPTDFSTTANNSISYAAKIAQAFSAELILLNIRNLVGSNLLIKSGQYQEILEESDITLNALCKEINRAYNISCGSDVIVTNESLRSVILRHENLETIVVIGSNGADDLYQLLYGSHSYQIAKASVSPVWIVPDNFEYNTIKNIVFAFSEKENLAILPQALPVFEIYNPNLMFLCISWGGLSEEESGSIDHEIKMQLSSNLSYKFEYIESSKVAKSITNYLETHEVDLLIICYGKSEMFVKKTTKIITKNPSIPILILHEQED